MLGRMGLALIFVVLGLEKCVNFDGDVLDLEAYGVPMASVLMFVSLIVELLGGLLVLVGYKTKMVAYVLSIYLVPTTLIFHPIWLEGTHIEDFMKNIGIVGGLLLLAYNGPGPKSIDAVHTW